MKSLTPIKFTPGQFYKRRDLHARFGGQQQGGICTPAKYPIIIIFSGETGTTFGYHDQWEDGIFKYIGEGQIGDMTFVRGNRALRDHIKDGKDVHLFQCGWPGIVKYVGQMICVGHSWRKTQDFNRKERNAIAFHLQFIDAETSNQTEKVLDLNMPLKTLRENALALSTVAPERKEKAVDYIVRVEAIRLYALKRAEGHCEACGRMAPFKTRIGEPFLECHHLRRLTDGGPDHPIWVAGVCPNCHRHIHYGSDGVQLNEGLISTIQKKETKLNWQN